MVVVTVSVSICHCDPCPRWCTGRGICGVVINFDGSRVRWSRLWFSWHKQGWLYESLL